MLPVSLIYALVVVELDQCKYFNTSRSNKSGGLIYNNVNNVFYLDRLIQFDVTLYSHTEPE